MAAPQAPWRVRLGSAFRTALACAIVGCTTLYGPEPVRQFLQYPSFSYVTAILIVSDATLGDALRGCWHVLYASIQVILPSMLTLWLIGPAAFGHGLAALAIALSSFAIALPDSTHLTAKRIAFGQTVIVYVGAVNQGAETGIVVHPLQVASSSALGALASALAMLFPFPKLAYLQARKIRRFYTENALNRLHLLVAAFWAKDKAAALNLITKARFLSRTAAKLLGSIKHKREGILWEKPRFGFLKAKRSDPGEKLQEMEMPIRGMELALTACTSTSFPIRILDAELQDVVQILNKQRLLKLEQAKCSVPCEVASAPETKGEQTDRSSWTQKVISTSYEDLSPFFFLYCMELLQDGPECNVEKKEEAKIQESKKQGRSRVQLIWSRLLSTERLIFATKCSLSLGLAVLLGLIYDKENGYWSGITIAVSFAKGRQATFTMANARAQGTAMGSVYGILCCFLFQKLALLRFLLLLPWIILTSFLSHSRMYGQAGAISAAVGALLILGRENYGSPTEFAIARIAEATIGLICFLTVEILLYPASSATLAKTELSRTLGALQDCLYSIQKEISREPREKLKKLRSHVSKLENFIADAGLEPNFLFLPFHCDCYNKLLKSLSKMADLFPFVIHQIEFLSQASQRLAIHWEEIREHINYDLEHLRDKIGSLIKGLCEVLLTKSQAELENELQMKNAYHEKPANGDVSIRLGPETKGIAEIAWPTLRQMMEDADKTEGNEVEEKFKRQMLLCMCSLGFCIDNLKKEAIETEENIGELLKWDHPEKLLDLHELLPKPNAT